MYPQKEFVIKSNDIIRNFKYDYSEREFKLIAYICSIYKKHESEVESIETFRFSVLIKDVLEVCGFDTSNDWACGKAYKEVRNLFRSLEKKSDWIPVYNVKGEEVITSVSWISKAYFENRDRVEFYADRDLYWYICGLTTRYTKYELENYMRMNGKHALRLYELFKSYEYEKKLVIEIGELKTLLSCDNKTKYKDNNHFLTLIVKPSIEEINAKTDLKIEMECIKSGRSISKIQFKIGKEKSREKKAV